MTKSKNVICAIASILGLVFIDYMFKIFAIDRAMVGNKIFDIKILSIAETFVMNAGVSFGIFSSIAQYIKYIVCLILILILFLMHRKQYPFYLLLIFAGALGNLIDRVLYEDCVVDFIEIILFKYSVFICNIADIYINLGFFIFIFYDFITKILKKKIH